MLVSRGKRGPVSPHVLEKTANLRGIADHGLAIHRLQALLEMRHQVGGHQRDAFRIAHQRLQRGPLRLEFFLLCQFLAFGDFLKLRVELRQFGGVQAELGTEGAKWGD